MWLKNDGLHSVETSLSFEETTEIFGDLAAFTEATQDPLTMREKIVQAYGLSATHQAAAN